MSTTNLSIRVVLAVTSDTALLDLKGLPNLIRSFDLLTAFFPSHTVEVAVSPENASQVREILSTKDASYELLISQSLDPCSLAHALSLFLIDSDAVLVHDASRPLTNRQQFENVLAAFNDDVDAVRPAMPFTETLKILEHDSVIRETLDRSTVLRISTPELIRVSAIDVDGPDCGWFLPLKKSAHAIHTEGGADGLRINSLADRDLMELL